LPIKNCHIKCYNESSCFVDPNPRHTFCNTKFKSNYLIHTVEVWQRRNNLLIYPFPFPHFFALFTFTPLLIFSSISQYLKIFQPNSMYFYVYKTLELFLLKIKRWPRERGPNFNNYLSLMSWVKEDASK